MNSFGLDRIQGTFARALSCASLLLAAALLSGCGHYRSGTGGYRSYGEFRGPSSYATASSVNALPPTSAPPKNYAPKAEFKLDWPVSNIRLSRGFKATSRRPHQGLDLGGSLGTPILSAHEGVVIYSGRDFRGYGNMVIVEYNKQWATLYGHLSKITVEEGKVVLPGDQLGKMGRTGRATGVHLHFELMRNRLPVDPLPFLSHSGQVAKNAD